MQTAQLGRCKDQWGSSDSQRWRWGGGTGPGGEGNWGGGPGTGNPGQVFLPLNVRLAYLLGLGLGNSVLGAAAVAWEWVGPRVQVERGTAGGKEEWPWVARATS